MKIEVSLYILGLGFNPLLGIPIYQAIRPYEQISMMEKYPKINMFDYVLDHAPWHFTTLYRIMEYK
jgi:hypothetical protein